MKCQKCGYVSKSNFVFCGKCGSKYERPEPEKRICQKCGRILTDEESFCFSCGNKYGDPVVDKEYVKAVPGLNETLRKGIPLNIKTSVHVHPTAWINGLRAASYIAFIATMILGIYQWVTFSDYGEGGFGFLIFLLCGVIGFFAVAGVMVFLDMAMDIRKICKTVEKISE